MKYELPERLKQQYLTSEAILNLIDTPGHVDFGYEVSRSLQAGEGAVLLVDATQGVQAQTLSNYQKAVDLGLTIIPVLNKVDLASVDVDRAMLEMMELFDFKEDEIIAVSAKTGLGVDRLLEAIVERLPAPTQNIDKPLRALAFSSQYDSHKGVVVYARVVDGVLSKENLKFYEAKASFYPSEVGIFTPEMKPKDKLVAGEVGYIATGMKEMTLAQIGDTIVREEETGIMALPGYKPPQLMVFMDFYPVDGDDFANLKLAMEKLKLNDSALQFVATHSLALGNGLRVGFLGIFHAEIVQERLEREFNLELIATSPSVRYEVK